MKKLTLTLLLFTSSLLVNSKIIFEENLIKFSNPKSFEILCLDDVSATPDSNGDFKSYEVVLPKFEKIAYYGCDERFPAIAPNNKTQMWVLDDNFKMLNAPENENWKDIKGSYTGKATKDGTYSIVKLENGKYIVILPLVGEKTMSRFTYEEGKNPKLTLFTWGTESFANQEVPVLAYAMCDNLYEANYTLWRKVLDSDLKGVTGTLRSEKQYPELFNYLGWCSWEEYKTNISEKVITNAINDINASKIPVRWILIDDGTQSKNGNKMTSFEPDKTKFPNGFEAITKLRDEKNIKWMGVWHYQSGYFGGIDPNNDMGSEFNKNTLKTLVNGTYRPQESYESQKRFLENLLKPSIDAGFDFVKIDFQGVQFENYKGNDNAVSAHLNTVRAQEVICKENDLNLLNCMSQDMISLLNTKHSVITRASQDYHFGIATGARIQTYQCYNTVLFLGQTSFADHDMFHSSDEMCNQMMSYSKAVSCAPVYLSDAPKNFVEKYISPLCYDDGELLKPLAPAAPLEESLFSCPINTQNLYKVIAPLDNGAASIICYNLYDKENVEISGSVSINDYKSASAMIQPYSGEWEIPAEGLIIYDVTKGKVSKFTKEYDLSLTGISANMLNLCPINKGWAVVGDKSKYLSPASVKDVEYTSKTLSFTPKSAGEYLFWTEKGTPYVGNTKCEAQGDGLFSVNTEKNQRVVISIN